MTFINRRLIKLVLAIFLISIGNSFAQSNDDAASRMKKYIKYLASDELEGRFPGTEGFQKAADYIKNHFANNKLDKFNDSYFQELEVSTGVKIGEGNTMSASVLIERAGLTKDQWKAATRNFDVSADWQPMIFSENGTVSGDLAFVGYGISSEPLKYDDYAGIDVKGKVVIMLIGSPDGESEKSKFSDYRSLRYKSVNARNNGAVGIIFVNPQGDSADVLKDIVFEMHSKNSGIYAVQMKRSVIAKLFPKNMQLNFIESEINKYKKSKSFIIANTSISMTINLEERKQKTVNVIGFVKGTKHPDEYIVAGGHFDHLGWGQLGNSAYIGSKPMIHNGADDNASGTAGVMELAERFAKNPAERTVVFIAFTGEEMGLLGSAYYADHNFVPHEKTYIMLNFDMIGRMKDNKVQLFGLGSSPRFPEIADSLAAIDSIGLVKLQDGFGPSDHTSFYKNKIPVMHFFTGIHEDYHKPADDWEKIDFEGAAKVVDYAEDIIRYYSNVSEKPEYIEVKDTVNKASMKMRGSGAWFGIVPNFEDSPDGCKISGTSPGSPAQKAGLQENDVISAINDKEVKNLHDFMFIVGEYKPGDTVKVKVIRDGKTKMFDVTLTSRK